MADEEKTGNPLRKDSNENAFVQPPSGYAQPPPPPPPPPPPLPPGGTPNVSTGSSRSRPVSDVGLDEEDRSTAAAHVPSENGSFFEWTKRPWQSTFMPARRRISKDSIDLMTESFFRAWHLPEFDLIARFDALTNANERWCMILMLRNKSFGYPGTDGTFWSNWKQYMVNRHPLISIFRAHRLHPFSKKERALCLWCSCCWSFFTATMMRFVYVDVCGGPLLEDCTWGETAIASIFLALLVVPFEILIRVLVICPCCRENALRAEGWPNEEEKVRALKWQLRTGWYTGLFLVLLSIAGVIVGLLSMLQVFSPRQFCDDSYDCEDDWFHLGVTTVYIKVFALIMWFPQWFIPFTIFYKKDKAEFMEKFPGQRCVEVSEEANLEDVQTNRKSIEMQKHLSPKIVSSRRPCANPTPSFMT